MNKMQRAMIVLGLSAAETRSEAFIRNHQLGQLVANGMEGDTKQQESMVVGSTGNVEIDERVDDSTSQLPTKFVRKTGTTRTPMEVPVAATSTLELEGKAKQLEVRKPIHRQNAAADLELPAVASENITADTTSMMEKKPKANPFQLSLGRCTCDFRNLTCLPTSECLSTMVQNEGLRVAQGVALRQRIKRDVSWRSVASEGEYSTPYDTPLGKATQYGTMHAWEEWVQNQSLLSAFAPEEYMFIVPENYPACRQKNLKGKRCFFTPFDAEERFGSLEHHASSNIGDEHDADNLYARFQDQRHHAQQVYTGSSREVNALTADWIFMSFAHLSRIRFNLEPFLENAYESHLSEINPGKGSLRVGLHIRRGDSCRYQERGDYATQAWQLDSVAQVTGKRSCWDTAVYVEALRLVQRRYSLPLTVYLATDEYRSILEDMKQNHSDFYTATTWRYLNYSHAQFEYKGSDTVIEAVRNRDRLGIMGETAATDLWHLSNAEIFVGHLGSRFGKVAYMLAAARHNTALPYISIDGHSLCCEIDENCSKATSLMENMVDCLMYAHENNGEEEDPDSYWKVGSTGRRPLLHKFNAQ